MPNEPTLFLKAPSSNDDVIIPKHSSKTDYEVEFCVVIGKYSEREFQLERGGRWVRGKSCHTFAPLGPFLVTKDEIPDHHALRLVLKVNGETRQDASTSDLIFNVGFLASCASQFMTLMPGT